MKKVFLIFMLIFCLIFSTSFVQGDEITNSSTETNKALGGVVEVLIVFLVLSVVFEAALTPVFNWRIFLVHFDGKGFKIPITVILAFLVFWGYGLDIIKDLLNSLGYKADIKIGGQLLTALLIAGGSDGVFRIFTKLGIRNPSERKQKAEESRTARLKSQGTKAKSN